MFESLQSRILAFLDLRSRIVLTAFGIGLFVWAIHEVRIGAGAKLEVVELSRLEEGYVPESTYLRIGEHIAQYQSLVYSTKERDSERLEAKVEYALVPIAVVGKDEAGKPVAVSSRTSKVTVVLKTKGFAQVKDFPPQDHVFGGVEGILIHDVEQLTQEEQNLLYSINPHTGHELWVLEVGREPWPLSAVAAMMSVGCALLLTVVGVVILDARRGKPAVSYEIVPNTDEPRPSFLASRVIQAEVDSVGLLFMSIVHALAGVTAVFLVMALTTLNPCLIGGSLVFAVPFNLAFWTRLFAALGPEDTEQAFGLRRRTWLVVLGVSYGLGVLAAASLGLGLWR